MVDRSDGAVETEDVVETGDAVEEGAMEADGAEADGAGETGDAVNSQATTTADAGAEGQVPGAEGQASGAEGQASGAESTAPDPWVMRATSYAPLTGSESIRRWTILGAIFGVIFIGGGFALATYAFGGGVAGAVAIGLMTAVFGGIGFGAMMGFVVQYAKQNEHDIG